MSNFVKTLLFLSKNIETTLPRFPQYFLNKFTLYFRIITLNDCSLDPLRARISPLPGMRNKGLRERMLSPGSVNLYHGNKKNSSIYNIYVHIRIRYGMVNAYIDLPITA